MVTAKFKVGDKVRILDGSKCEDYTGGWSILFDGMHNYVGKICVIKSVNEFCNKPCYRLNNTPSYFWDERYLELVQDWKVVIIPDGDTTIGKLYEGDKVVKEVTTRKSPSDEYSKEEAIKVITERLTAPTYYNGKVVCIDGSGGAFITGKIYTVNEGKLIGEDGTVFPNYGDTRYKSFDDIVLISKFIEVVE